MPGERAPGKEVLMTRVIFGMSMSLDGFVNASNVWPEESMGDGGERLHGWFFGGDERNRELLAEAGSSLGAVIAGRRTYDLSVPPWGLMARLAPHGYRFSSSPTPSRRTHPKGACTPSLPTGSRAP
jgi:dihydrofolate reductase